MRVNSGLTYGAEVASRHLKPLVHLPFYLYGNENTEAAIDLALKTYARLWEQALMPMPKVLQKLM